MSETAPGRPAPEPRRRARWVVAALLAALAGGVGIWQYDSEPRFLHTPTGEFVALFATPPAPDSAQTRAELVELLALQTRRTPAQVAAADRDRKTEVWQFASALGLTDERLRELDALRRLAEWIEDDMRPYVRAAKHRFLRLRPYEVEPRLDPCIADVRGDLSYPSGHATYGYVMAYLLADLVPERREALLARARDFALQRSLCGVHFPSDLEAGRLGAQWLARHFLASEEYRRAAESARAELRTAVPH